MPIQVPNDFTPIQHKHYEMGDTEAQKQAADDRKAAMEAASQGAATQRTAMSLAQQAADNESNNAQRDREAASSNDLAARKINADLQTTGLQNARYNQQQDRLLRNDANTNAINAAQEQRLTQQGLSTATLATNKDAREADAFTAEKKATEEKAARDKQILDQHDILSAIGGVFNNMKPNAKQVDLSSVAQQVGSLSGQNADEFKGRNIVGVYDKDGMLSINEQIDTPNGRQLNPIMRNGQPINLSPKTQQMMSTLNSESFGFKTPDKKDNIDIKTDPNTGENTGWDKQGNQVKLNTLADQELNRLNKTANQTPADNTNVPTEAPQAGLGGMNKSVNNSGVNKQTSVEAGKIASLRAQYEGNYRPYNDILNNPDLSAQDMQRLIDRIQNKRQTVYKSPYAQ